MASIKEANDADVPASSEIKEKIKAQPGKVIKQVLKSKKTITAEDGEGDWEVIGKRETYLIEKAEDSDDDDDSY